MIFEFIILAFLCFWVARKNTMYHPHLLIKNHIVVKNENAAKLLICRRDMYNRRGGGRLIPKANRNKMLIPGLVFYILTAVAVLFTVVMAWFPDVYSEAVIYAEGSVNRFLSEFAFYIILAAELAFDFINSFKRADEIKVKSGAILMRVISVVMITMFSFGIVFFVYLAIRLLSNV